MGAVGVKIETGWNSSYPREGTYQPRIAQQLRSIFRVLHAEIAQLFGKLVEGEFLGGVPFQVRPEGGFFVVDLWDLDIAGGAIGRGDDR